MDIIDYLILELCEREYASTLIVIFGIDEVNKHLNYGTIILKDGIISINIQ
jgi:hypothetical protein